jgi:hypothetical protein
MGSGLQTAALPFLSLILLVWSQVPGLQGHEFRFGSCRVEGVVLPELWEAFQAMKHTVVSGELLCTLLWGSPGGGSMIREPFTAC